MGSNQLVINTVTRKSLLVSNLGGVRPSVRFPYAQLADLCNVLDSNKIRYTIEDNVISFDGGPAMAVIYFERSMDAHALQEVLDKAQ